MDAGMAFLTEDRKDSGCFLLLDIMSNMQMLALNASIEASKAGVHGRGFTVVADHLGKSVEAVRNLTQEINQVNQNIIQVAKQSEGVLEKLR